ncbi:hypothetical protein X798_07243 [Onchocerca flexuosa]|uniref:Uncharacterized protein n=1 Tax=Onchocerca flexuosa TaxID=387005 RepID=A0A238BKN0_9BILA|nr:hypothetical protein X798_07243 [Onchocerca flexuosa]
MYRFLFNTLKIGAMSFFSKDIFDCSISKSRERKRLSTVSHSQPLANFPVDTVEGERIKKRRRLEQHSDMKIPKHSNDNEQQMVWNN